MVLFIIVLQALLGLSFTIGKLCLAHGAPCFLIATRMIIGGLALLISYAIQQRTFAVPKRDIWRACLPYAFFGIFGFPVLRAWGLQFIPSAKAALFFALFPLTTALVAFFVRGERLSIVQIAGLCIACLGTLPLMISGNIATLSGSPFSFALPELAILCSVFFFSFGLLSMQTLIKDHGHAPLLANGISMLMGGALAFSSSCATESSWISGDIVQLTLLMGLQILVSNIVCSNLQAFLLKRYSATLISLTSFIAPLFSIFYGAFFLNEAITWHLFVALLAVVIGLSCYHVEDIRQKRGARIPL